LSIWALGTVASIYFFFRSPAATLLGRFMLIAFWLVMALPILFLVQEDLTPRSVILTLSQWAALLAIIAAGFGLKAVSERRR
jgi:hypothetical protein